MKRALAIHIPFLSTDRLRRSHSATGIDLQGSSSHTTDDKPVVTVSSRGQALHIVHLSRTAYEQGIRPGQTLADAKAMVPDIVTHDDDPTADRRQLESLAVWAGCLSPIVHIEDHDTLLADVTGCEQLFKGEANLLSRAIEGLKAQGFTARGAIADTPGGAWAIAHAHPEPAVIAGPGQTSAELVPLPVWSLRIDPKTIASLASVGVETIASLLYLPRSSLASRFGEALCDRIDQALGDLPEVLTPYRPPSALTSRFHLGAATTRIDRLTEAIRQALERFCKQLERR
ncbi:MAG: Y-family DNA polymerase, partial [Planctomycetota bacterium]